MECRYDHVDDNCSQQPSEQQELSDAVRARADALVDVLCAFFVQAGLSSSEIAGVLNESATRVRRQTPTLSVPPWNAWIELGEAVADWWRDARYVDDEGRPHALAEYGPAPSIEALLLSRIGADDVAGAKDMLRRCVNIDADGRWQFAHDGPALALRGEYGIQRLQVLLAGLLRTFLENNAPGPRDIHKNFEKSAASLTFPKAMLPAFRVRMKNSLDVVIEDVDAWISRHSAQCSGSEEPEAVCTVGVEIFAYTFPARESACPRSSP